MTGTLNITQVVSQCGEREQRISYSKVTCPAGPSLVLVHLKVRIALWAHCRVSRYKPQGLGSPSSGQDLHRCHTWPALRPRLSKDLASKLHMMDHGSFRSTCKPGQTGVFLMTITAEIQLLDPFAIRAAYTVRKHTGVLFKSSKDTYRLPTHESSQIPHLCCILFQDTRDPLLYEITKSFA